MRPQGDVHLTLHFRGLIAGFLLFAATGTAQAQFNQSEKTDVDLDACTVVQSDDFGSTWACNGYKGIPVMIREVSQRFKVSYGLTSTTEKAASQTLPPVHHLGDSIEWRLSNIEGGYKSFATILRFHVKREADPKADSAAETPDGEVLVVTKVSPGATCQVAWIDALANPDAEALARQTADEKVPDFDCAKEPEIVGKFEAWDVRG